MRFIIISLLTIFSFSLSFGQKTLAISVEAGYPVPNSGFTFENRYIGLITGGATLQKSVVKNLNVGVAMRYHLFQIRDLPLFEETKMRILNPAIVVNWNFNPNGKWQFKAGYDIGFSFIKFSNTDFPGLDYEENGFTVRPQLTFQRKLTKSIFLELNGNYNIIFQPFREFLPTSSVFEESTTRFAAIDLGIEIRL